MIQSIKDFFQLASVLGLNSFLGPIVKEIFQAFVQEGLDHRNSVTLKVTFVKKFLKEAYVANDINLTQPGKKVIPDRSKNGFQAKAFSKFPDTQAQSPDTYQTHKNEG